jgi:hypothetical protein
MMQPLLDVGIEIRKRFLEKTARTASTYMEYQHLPNEVMIIAGNDVANQPNAEANLTPYELKYGDIHKCEEMLSVVYRRDIHFERVLASLPKFARSQTHSRS